MLKKPHKPGSAQRGFAMIITLVFVGFFAAILTSIIAFNRDQNRENQATVAGSEAVQIAKAARMYVRDQLAANPATTRADAIAGKVIAIDTDLQDRGYLPAAFGRRLGANNFRNVLNQRIYVVMAMYPPGSTATSAIPTAYVYLDPSTSGLGTPLARYMLLAAESARREGTAISAPTFDTSGNNTSPTCTDDSGNTTPAAAIWDTGCLTNNEFAVLSSIASPTGPSTLPAGGFIIPTWRSEKFDLRAVMRFPQPENPGGSTMLSDLDMGIRDGTWDAIAGRVVCAAGTQTIQTTRDRDDGTYEDNDTGLCKVLADGATPSSRDRFNITGINNLISDYLIADPTQQNDGASDPHIELKSITSSANVGTATNAAALRIAGDAAIRNDVVVYDKIPLNSGVSGATSDLRQRLSFTANGATDESLRVGRNISVQAATGLTATAELTPEVVAAPTYYGTMSVRNLRTDRINGKTLNAYNDNSTTEDFADDARVIVGGNVNTDRLLMDSRVTAAGNTLSSTSIVTRRLNVTGKTTVSNDMQTLGAFSAGGANTRVTGVAPVVAGDGTAYSVATGILNVSGRSTINDLRLDPNNASSSITANGASSTVARLDVGNGGSPKAICEDNPAYTATTGHEGCPNIQDAPTVIDP